MAHSIRTHRVFCLRAACTLTLTIALGVFLIASASAQIGPPIGPPPVTVYQAPIDPYTLAQPSDGYVSTYEAKSLLSIQEVALAPVFWPWFGAWWVAVGFPEQPWTTVEGGLFIPMGSWFQFRPSNL